MLLNQICTKSLTKQSYILFSSQHISSYLPEKLFFLTPHLALLGVNSNEISVTEVVVGSQ